MIGRRRFALSLALLLAGCTRGQAGTQQASPPASREPMPAESEHGEIPRDPGSGSAQREALSELAQRGATAQLALLRAMPDELLERITAGGRPDETGLVGHNRPDWHGAQYQRGAVGRFLYAVSRNDRTEAENAWRAIDVAFAHQTADGDFDARNESGTRSAPKDVYSDVAFWLAQLCQALLVARASPVSEEFHARIEALLPGIRHAADLLLTGRATLVEREASATNRYFIDALAYALSGLLLNDERLVDTGAYFVGIGLGRQHAEGFFEEKGGADTSYNSASMLMLQVYDLYFSKPAQQAALARAAHWQLQHVGANGEIDVRGNTRTGLQQERYFGEPKRVNYPEAILCLLYFGARNSNTNALDTARRVYSARFQR